MRNTALGIATLSFKMLNESNPDGTMVDVQTHIHCACLGMNCFSSNLTEESILFSIKILVGRGGNMGNIIFERISLHSML